MKKVFLSLGMFSIALVLIITTLAGCKKAGTSDNLDWETNLEIALQKAQKENKAVLVNFTGSDWCIWCQRLSNEVFSQSEFEKFAKENLVLVKIDFPKNIELPIETKMYNNQLAQRFGVEGFPTIFILNKNGEVTLQTGYQPGGAVNYINHLKSYM
ncbi:MAG: thioredoxin family protein [Ignavibacterium sp.]